MGKSRTERLFCRSSPAFFWDETNLTLALGFPEITGRLFPNLYTPSPLLKCYQKGPKIRIYCTNFVFIYSIHMLRYPGSVFTLFHTPMRIYPHVSFLPIKLLFCVLPGSLTYKVGPWSYNPYQWPKTHV